MKLSIGCIQLVTSFFPADLKLDLPLNSFKTKAAGFYKRSSLNFALSKKIEWPSDFRSDVFNQIQSKLVSFPGLFAKLWAYLTETKASMPPLWFCRSKTINCLNSAGRGCWRQVLRRCFPLQERGIVVVIYKFFAKLFHCHKFYRPSNSRREFGKIQPIAELTFSRALNVLNSNIECVNAFTFEFCRSITGGLQIPAPYWAQWRQTLAFHLLPSIKITSLESAKI